MTKTLCIGMLLLALVASCEKKTAVSSQIFGVEPLRNVTLVGEPGSALTLWAKRGYSDMILVHISSSDGLAFSPDENIRELKRLVRGKKWDELEKANTVGPRKLFDPSNYLYVALQLGIIKKIYWVLPHRFFEYIDVERRVKDFLSKEASLFEKEDLEKMTLKEGCVSGRLYGSEVHICSPESLPAISEPVLLDLGIDFFVSHSAARQKSLLEGMKTFFDIMDRKMLRVVSAEIASAEKSSLDKPFNRYIGPQIVEALKDPKIMKAESPPELWRSRDIIQTLLSGGEPGAALEHVEELLQKHPDDPSLPLFRAVGLAWSGRTGESLDLLSELARKDSHYIHLFVFLAREFATAKKYGEAEKFFKKAIEVKHGFPDALLGYADMMFEKKDFAEALKYYEAAAVSADSLSLQLYIGDCFYLLGRMDEAMLHYEKAAALYNERVRFVISDRSRDSLQRMLELSEKRINESGAATAKRLLASG